MEQGKGQKPRLLVLGNARFASDEGLQRYSARGRGVGYPFIDLVSSSLAWLRERPNSIGLDPKNRKVFMLSEKTNVSRMIHLPTVVMLLCIFGMGFGVWVVRRR
jgi:hypothetical protein